MRLIRFGAVGEENPGVLLPDGTRIDVSAFGSDYDEDFFADGGLTELARWVRREGSSAPRVASSVRLAPPIRRPSKIVCIGLNFRDHAAESKMEIPKEPVIFFKSTTSMVGPNDPLVIPRRGEKVKKPLILTVGEYFLVLDLLPQPYRTMVVVAQCLGLRAEEVLALHWSDVSFERLIGRVSRAVVSGGIKTVKTEYSEDELPLDADFAAVLLDWKACAPASALMFPSHVTGRNFHASPIQQDYIRPAGCCLVACPNCSATSGTWCKNENGKRVGLHDERWDSAGSYGHVGWHTFRHTYRSWLDATGAPLGVQQKLMRHGPDLDHNERLRQRADGFQARCQQQGS